MAWTSCKWRPLIYAPISLHSSRLDRRCCHDAFDRRFHEEISPLRSYFIPIFILLRLRNAHLFVEACNESPYKRLSDRNAILCSRWKWRRYLIGLLTPPIESFSLRFFARLIWKYSSTPTCSRAGRIHLAKIKMERKRATSRKTPSSGISRSDKEAKRNALHASREGFWNVIESTPIFLKFYSYANLN